MLSHVHASSAVSPEWFRTVQLALFCGNVCVNFRVNFRKLFAFLRLEISGRFRCSDVGLTFLPRTRNRQPRAHEPLRGTVATKLHAPEPF